MTRPRHSLPAKPWRSMASVAAAILGLAIISVPALNYAQQTSALGQRATVAEVGAYDLAQQVAIACARGELKGQLCASAAAVPVPGAQGERGPMGPAGAPGLTPPCYFEAAQCRGKDGTNGKDGAEGKDGVDGKNGKDGVDGKAGKDGADGKDAPTPTTSTPPSPQSTPTPSP